MSRIYVGRIKNARLKDIERFFENFGRLRDIKMMKGYCFVEFKRSKDAENAVHGMNGKMLCGDRVIVEMAHSSKKRYYITKRPYSPPARERKKRHRSRTVSSSTLSPVSPRCTRRLVLPNHSRSPSKSPKSARSGSTLTFSRSPSPVPRYKKSKRRDKKRKRRRSPEPVKLKPKPMPISPEPTTSHQEPTEIISEPKSLSPKAKPLSPKTISLSPESEILSPEPEELSSGLLSPEPEDQIPMMQELTPELLRLKFPANRPPPRSPSGSPASSTSSY